MNLQHLQDLFIQHPLLKKLEDGISLSQPKFYELKNLYGSTLSFFAQAFWKQQDYNHVFILNDFEEAAYFQNDFEKISETGDVCYFPSSFKRFGDFSQINNSHLLLRAESLLKFEKNNEREVRKKVIVTYPEALFEKVIPSETYQGNILLIRKNETLDITSTIEFFLDLGFTREEFVYEPGQFSIRGGILDIFSFGNEHPYRIELFDNEVESIRSFDPETQLSIRQLLQIRIVPDMDKAFREEGKISFLDNLPENTLIWLQDIEGLLEQFKKLQEKLREQLSKQNPEEENRISTDENRFDTPEHFIESAQKYNVLHFGDQNTPCYFPEHQKEELVFHTREQPSFNKNFNLIIEDLKQKTVDQYQIFIGSENPKQSERLHSIFKDLGEEIVFTPIPFSVHRGFLEDDVKIVFYTDHQLFQRYHKYNVKKAYSKGKALTRRSLNELTPGDFITHIDHGIGVYSGLQKIEVNGVQQESVRIIYRDNDVLYVNINSLHKISKYTGKDGTQPKVHKLGSQVWEKMKAKTKRKIKDIAADLIKLYAKRKAVQGFAHQADTYLQNELEASFIYEDTPDQVKATLDVKKDMENENPMDRLVCGDVGFGKTEIAIRAAFKSATDGKQAAILVPTTILAYQHYQTFRDRLKDFPVTVDYLNRFKSAKEKKETLLNLKEGKTDIIIATHALLSKDISFKDLGLFVIDEEQKFGVAAKEKIRALKTNVDTLTLTATPIPRTLQFSLMGARDLSIINTPPPNRQEVDTEVHVMNDEIIRDAIYYEVERGGQVYFIHNRVKDIEQMRTHLLNLCPDIRFGLAHGQMKGDELENSILSFINQEFDVLLCTNIVESGVDIPNANTIMINNAHHFGLSDLHQLRGRVGRSSTKAFCYLFAPPLSTLPGESKKRLQTLEQFSDLGSGFQIAMRDLDIRGAGNLLGGEQSGFITDIGLETYQKILNEAIRELKQNEFKDLFAEQNEKEDMVDDCTIDTDTEILIPDEYVESIQERLFLYHKLDNLETEEELQKFAQEMTDRFGPIPGEVEELFTALRTRWIAKKLGFEKLIFRNRQLRLYFISNPESSYFDSPTFKRIMEKMQTHLPHSRLKNVGKNFMLIMDHVRNLEHVKMLLEQCL